MASATHVSAGKLVDSAATGGNQRMPDVPDLHQYFLNGVSRTFAFTIPQLPENLRDTVTNAYLICRIADTIEDDPALDATNKDRYHRLFLDAVRTGQGADAFADSLAPILAPSTLPAEVELVRFSPEVLAVTQGLGQRPRRAIIDCLAAMSHGMASFARRRSRSGLADVAELERYCYYVAGVVGEMLTELFCDFSPKIDAQRNELEQRAVSFGLGLQMTNILKDIWDDYEHGACWLPRDLFKRNGYDLAGLAPHEGRNDHAFAASIQELIGTAHGHLRHALDYTLLMPGNEIGIRRFLIWAVLLAVSTLRKISTQPLFTGGSQVKVSRRRVTAIVAASNAVIRSNFGLTTLFNVAARGLPVPEHDRSGQIE